MSTNHNLAAFVDFENVALGAEEAKLGDFSIDLVLERLHTHGSTLVKRAYADWTRYTSAKRPMHEAGFELIEVPHARYSGKNSADIQLVVDALDLAHTKPHIDHFAIVSGDSDFSPLVRKLRENGKTVVGIGVKGSTSSLLVESCDTFVYYDSLVSQVGGASPDQAIDAVVRTAAELLGERSKPVWGSHVKQVLRRRQPSFSETDHGFRSFNQLLEAAAADGRLKIQSDDASGGYRVADAVPA